MNQRGQAVIEAVLIMVLLVGLATAVGSGLRNMDFFVNLVERPWQNLSGLIQNGVWEPPQASMSVHPNANNRHISLLGDPVE